LIAGNLPSGLTLSRLTDSLAAIQGTPTDTGSFPITVEARDSSYTMLTDTASFNVVIAAPGQPVAIITSSLPAGNRDQSYSASVCAAAGTTPYTWRVVSGQLPPGLDTTSSGCLDISGIPTVAGTYTFRARVTDSGDPPLSDTGDLSITISAPPLDILTASLPSCTTDVSYDTTVCVTGGTPPYAWQITGDPLPAGIDTSWADSCVIISGTPTVPGTSSFTVKVTDSGSPQLADSAALGITIHAVPLAIPTTSLPSCTTGATYDTVVCVTGGTPPYSWEVTNGTLPRGIDTTWADSCLSISGSPDTVISSAFRVRVTDSGSPQQAANRDLGITVTPPPVRDVTPVPLLRAGSGVCRRGRKRLLHLVASFGQPASGTHAGDRGPAALRHIGHPHRQRNIPVHGSRG
jgi:hypothetical protein